MDEGLKARSLGSAKARKAKSVERQRQKEILFQQREERRKRLARYSQAYSTHSDSNDTPDLDSSGETPSEHSASTPDDMSATGLELHKQFIDDTKDIARLVIPNDTGKATTKPQLGASLTRLCDFSYDRFSVYMGQSDERQEESSSDETDDEEPSPIELATPVSYTMPKTRPTVVQIRVVSDTYIETSKKEVTTPQTGEQTLTPAPLQLNKTYYQAATRPHIGRFQSESLIDTTTAALTSNLDQAVLEKFVKKKPSTPMLSKFTHNRVNSIKQFIKPGSIPPLQTPAVPQMPAHHSRPSTSTSYEPRMIPRRSITEPPNSLPQIYTHRPQTARQTSQSSLAVMSSAMSNYSTTSLDITDDVSYKKPFANLRRRSGSIGQALKLGNSRPKAGSQGMNPPPMPDMPVLHRYPSQDSISLLSTASQSKSSVSEIRGLSTRRSGLLAYSPFPSQTQREGSVGLGLRMN